MSFLHDRDTLALVDERSGGAWTHADLRHEVRVLATQLSELPRSLAFCRCALNAATVVNYLAALAAGHPLVMVDAGMQGERLAELERRYQPRLVLHPDREC